MDDLRINRIRSLMKDEVTILINRDLKDPRVPVVTVTDVQMTKDARQATVFISILPVAETQSDPKVMANCLEGLNSAKGYIRKNLSAVMGLRFMPELLFKEDKGLENTLRVNELLKQLEAEKKVKTSS